MKDLRRPDRSQATQAAGDGAEAPNLAGTGFLLVVSRNTTMAETETRPDGPGAFPGIAPPLGCHFAIEASVLTREV